MIKHFTKITGTGKFLNYLQSAAPPERKAVVFNRINLIYGENGSGKTTLSLILRSMRGEDELLLKKRSFDHSIPQQIEVAAEGTPHPQYVFSNGEWNHHLPGIEVFDVHFINENVYTGLEIQNTHKKNLFEVILGQQGIQLKSEIQVIKERIQKGNKVTRETVRDIETAIDNAYSARQFAKMEAEPDIEAKIAEKEHEIEAASHHQDILQKAILAEIPKLQPDGHIAGAEAVLVQSVDKISEKYLEKFSKHKDHLGMGGQSEDWIKQGYEAIHDNACPFCQRPFNDTVEILEACRQYFNETYNRLIADIARLNGALNNLNPEARLLEIENSITTNLTLIDFWKNYLGRPPALHSLLGEKGRLLEAFEQLKECFQNKVANPVQAQDAAPLAAFKSTVDSINQTITIFNAGITAFNSSISLMQATDGPDIPNLALELKQLQALQKKDDPEMDTWCKNLLIYEEALEKLKKLKDEKKARLDHFKNAVFDKHLTAINRYLQAFAPYLELRQLTSVYIGSSTEPSVKFALCIEGKEVLQKDDPKRPSVKYSLSEGDKNALALAFFLASLERDPHLCEKIIVFDDPGAHFDEKRMATLLSYLVFFGQKARQLFLLTHDLGVVEGFGEKMQKATLPFGRFRLGEVGGAGVILSP
jgi:wobble nucleotide-excising tRNase